jgi:hypothetical protein
VRFLLLVCVLAGLARCAVAQEEGELTARRRIFSNVGAGLRSLKLGPDGRFYLVVSPAPGVLVFDATWKPVLQIGAGLAAWPGTKAQPAKIVFGEDCDVDASGRIYVADRGANQVLVFSTEGLPLKTVPVSAPVAIAATADGEFAVATLREPHLVMVFDKDGHEVREFGDPEPIAERVELNRYLNIGQLATDTHGQLYYGFAYLPEPTVRQYDRYGYAGQDIQYTALEAMPAAQATRKEIERQERRGDPPVFRRILTAVGVDPTNGDVWMALHNKLLHFDKEGIRRASYLLYTPEEARLEASVILVEKDRLIIGSDPLGIYEFIRPDKKFTK